MIVSLNLTKSLLGSKKSVQYFTFGRIGVIPDREYALREFRSSYGHLWCMGIQGRWRILLIDFFPDFNNREMIRHDQVYPTGFA